MFSAIGRWFKSLGYLLTGRVDRSRRGLDTNPDVVRATYNSIITTKNQQIKDYQQAVAGLMSSRDNKMDRLKELTGDVEKYSNLKAGALAKAKKRVDALKQQGLDQEGVNRDPDYIKCREAFNDFNSTLEEKQKFISELENDVEGFEKSIKDHKAQLSELMREIEKISEESHEAVAEIITAKQEKEIADMISGITVESSSAELQRMRQLRQELKSEANLSRELAGIDTKSQEQEFMAYAKESMVDSEFDRLSGLAEEADTSAKETEPREKDRDAQLPE